ncbi:MAG: alpha/beta hydrolase [Pseudomonadota bacterium]
MIDIGEEAFEIWEAGDPGAPLLLMLHGFPEHAGAWAELAERLSGAFHCVAPNQRGYGRSPRPAQVEAYRTGRLVRDAMGVLDRFGGRARAVIGHDWGASVAYALAIVAPERMDRLVIGNGVHPIPFQRALAAGGAQSEASRYIETLRAAGSEARLAADGFAGLLRLVSANMDLGWMTEARRAEYVEAWSQPGALRGMVNWYRATPLQVARPGEPLPEAALPRLDAEALRVRVPHLLLWGERDTALLPETREGLDALCDSLRVQLFPDCDHWLFHQAPEALAAQIRAFLD